MKNNLVRKLLIGSAVILLLVLQFFRGEKPEVIKENPSDLLVNHQLSPEISNILKSACYDCHSNETSYPWYSYVTPFSWLIFDHISHGREELNFSEWTTLRKSRKIRKLEDIREQIVEGEMPMKSYKIMHGSARLSLEEKDLIVKWTESFTEEIMND